MQIRTKPSSLIMIAAAAVLAAACTPVAPSVHKKDPTPPALEINVLPPNSGLSIPEPQPEKPVQPISDFIPVLLSRSEAAAENIPDKGDLCLDKKTTDVKRPSMFRQLIELGATSFRLPLEHKIGDPQDQLYIVFVIQPSREQINSRRWKFDPSLKVDSSQHYEISMIEKEKQTKWTRGEYQLDTKMMLKASLKDVCVYAKSALSQEEIDYFDSKAVPTGNIVTKAVEVVSSEKSETSDNLSKSVILLEPAENAPSRSDDE